MNKINQIQLSQMVNATSVKRILGTKLLKNLKVKNLEVAQMLNNVPLNFVESSNDKSTLDLIDGFEFQGDINVKHLKVKSLNRFNVSSVLSNVFLTKDSSTIKGNLILQDIANIDSLVTGSLMEVPVENLMTTSTDQIVTADVFINKFFVRNFISDSINDEDFSENIALLNEENVIEGEEKL